MIIYNDIKNLTPYQIEPAKMKQALKQDDVKLIDLDALTSEEYYDFAAERKQVINTQEKIKQYIDAAYQQTFAKSNLTIYFSWFVEILTFKYGIVGLNLGAQYLNAYLDLIVEHLDTLDEEQVAVCIKHLIWLGDRLGVLLQNVSLVQPGIEPSYNIADYIHMTKPGASKRLLTEEEEETLTLDKFNEAIDKCPIEYLQTVLNIIGEAKNNLNTLEEKISNVIEKKSLEDMSGDVFYATKSTMDEIVELYNQKLGKGEPAEEEEEDLAKAYATQSEAEQASEEGAEASIESTRNKIQDCINFLEDSYPHTPVIMLLKAANQWLGMSFDDIINSLMQRNASLESLYAMLTPPAPPPPMGGGPGGYGGGGMGPDMGPGGGMPPPPNF